MYILSILHNIFLTEEEVNRLHKGESINVIGVSLPVWSANGNTSEPAEEVFCNYTLTNLKQEESIEMKKDGYNINLPQLTEDSKEPEISDQDWRAMTQVQKDEWYEKFPEPVSSLSLLPISKGGSEYLHFKSYNKIKKQGKVTTLVHIVDIKLKEKLLTSLI